MSQSTTTWQHAAPVRWLRSQSVERRQTILAAAFALISAVWAPLGVLAVLTQSTTTFLVISLAAAVVLAAPRPSVGDGDLEERLAGVTTWLREGLRRDLGRAGRWAKGVAETAVEAVLVRLEQRQDRGSSTSASS